MRRARDRSSAKPWCEENRLRWVLGATTMMPQDARYLMVSAYLSTDWSQPWPRATIGSRRPDDGVKTRPGSPAGDRSPTATRCGPLKVKYSKVGRLIVGGGCLAIRSPVPCALPTPAALVQ